MARRARISSGFSTFQNPIWRGNYREISGSPLCDVGEGHRGLLRFGDREDVLTRLRFRSISPPGPQKQKKDFFRLGHWRQTVR